MSRPLAARRTAHEQGNSAERIMWLPRAHLGGISMTTDEALRLSAVWACVTVVAKALASCSWDVFLERENGDRVPRRRVAAYSLLNIRPNPEMTAYAFKEAMWIVALIEGNFYAEIEYDRGGRPVALWPLATERCTLERDDADELVLVVRNRNGGEVVLDYSDVFHIHGPGIDGVAGFETVTLAARGLAHAAAAERFGQSFYHNNTQLGGLISFQNSLSPDARDATTKAIESGRKGSENAWGLLTLDNGAKYQQFGVEPDKAQFIETRHLLIEEVCRWFGVPPHKVAHLLRSTFSNIEHQSIEFVRDALTPWAERARQEADWKLLRPWPGIRTRIDLEWLSEGDAKSKAETDSTLVQNGIANRNEIRRRRGLNHMGSDGDKYTIQVNMTTLDKVGELQASSESPRVTAARALFRSAALRAMRRRTRIAEGLIECGVCDASRLRDAIEADDKEHARYVGAQVGDCLIALGVDGEPDGLRDELARFIEDDATLMKAGFDNETQELGVWCDMDARAEAVACDLARLIER